jgi:ParB/RepB/Spo0J family partition protein
LRASIEDAGIHELAASIGAVGLLQPIGVVERDGRYAILFGHRRFLACRWLGHVGIDATVLTVEEASELEASAAENVVRRDLSPVEEARAIKHMVEAKGRTIAQVGAALGRSAAWVRSRLDMLLWPADVLDAVARGDLKPAVAGELVLVEEELVRAHYLRAAVDSGCTAAQARMWRQDWEVTRTMVPAPEVGTEGARDFGPAVLPSALCYMCRAEHVLTNLQYLRVCVSCETALRRAQREEEEERTVR